VRVPVQPSPKAPELVISYREFERAKMSRRTALFLCLLPFWLAACGPVDEHGLLLLNVQYTSPTSGSTAPADTSVSAFFDQIIDPDTANAGSFKLTRGDEPALPGVVEVISEYEAVLTLSAPLEQELEYTATITRNLKGFEGETLAADYVWRFSVANAAPTVESTTPSDAAVGVSIQAKPSITFSEAVDPASVTASTFRLLLASIPVAGTPSLDAGGRRAVFTPATALGVGLTYSVDVDASVTDLSGLPLGAGHAWSFTTESAAIAPTVTATVPLAAATNVGLAGPISATFSEEMAGATFDAATFLLTEAGVGIAGAVSYVSASRTAIFIPSAPLRVDAVHTATIKSSVTDSAGTALGVDSTWTFTTLDGKPTVIGSSPLSTAPYISINDKLRATFSAPMNAATLSSTTFTVTQGETPVLGSVAYVLETSTATFTPSVAMAPGQPYTARISAAATDLNGRTLAPGFSWSFTTTSCSMLPVALGAASSFAVLGGGGVSDTESSFIVGNVGVSPASNISGFAGGSIIGTTHANTQAAIDAQAALGLAYADALGRDAGCAATLNPQLGGQTLTPGLYRSPMTLSNGGALTLDAQGDADAVFIFQGGGLTGFDGSRVELVGGARAANVFWQLNASATLSGDWVGTVMAMTNVSLQLGAVLSGRALARNGLITLDACDVQLLEL
jgi:ice-binding like protein/Big-like domain-containing protein